MVRSRRQSEMEDEAVAQTMVISSNAQDFHGSLQDVKKLKRLSEGFDYSRLNLERRTKGIKDKVDINKVKEAKLNAKRMKHSPEDYDEIGNLRQVPLTCRPNLWTV